MWYTFFVYPTTGEIHIKESNEKKTLCGMDLKDLKELEGIGIAIYQDDNSPSEEIAKPFTDLHYCEALAVAHALEALEDINICANCVRSLYKNK